MPDGEMTQGQHVDFWRRRLADAWRQRTRYPHGAERRMLVAHPLKVLRGWLKISQEQPDGSPVAWPAIFIEEAIHGH